jgi:hypothetical protein
VSTRYESFLPEVLPYVPDCPEIVAVNAIRNACIDFCDKSLYWLYTHDPVTTLDNVSTYELELPDYTTSVAILDAWYNNMPLIPQGEDELRRILPLNWPTLYGTPKYLTQQNPGEVILVPYPLIGLSQGLNMTIALKPTRDSVDIDDSIYENWAEGIGYGARARIHALPHQSFSDPVASVKYEAMFNTAIGKATVARNRGLARTVQRVRPPRFF